MNIRKLSVSLIIPIILTSPSIAQSGFTVGGDIHLKGINKTGNLYIFLVTEKTFKIPLKGYKQIVLKIGLKEIKMRKVSFKFTGIPAGRYGIRCFLDQDGNGKLNKGIFGPSEPWGMSWQEKKPSGWPRFKYIAFNVNKDITNIRISVK